MDIAAAEAASGNKCWLLKDFESWEPLPAKMNVTRGPGARGVQMPEEDQFWIVGTFSYDLTAKQSSN